MWNHVLMETGEKGGHRLSAVLRRPSFWLRLSIVAAVGYFLVTPLVSNVESASGRLSGLDHRLTAVAVALQLLALLSYSVMTKLALGDESRAIGLGQLVRIQLITRALGSTVPGGAAAGPAVGYRLITNAGVPGGHASAALASGSVVSAAMLNLMLWMSLVVSIPIFGFNVVYAVAAVAGIVVMLLVAAVLVAIVDRSALVDRAVHFATRRVGIDGDGLILALRSFGEQLRALLGDRPTMARLSAWAVANWVLDAASLWIFLQAFGVTMNPIGVLVAFGVANILAALPITPGGIGVVEWAYIPILVTFGAGFEQATIAVASYRIVQLLMPMLLGSLSAVSLSVESRRRSSVFS